MSELTAEQEKIERRRQKRQQRILQSGESRLSKITGTAYPNRATPSPTPSPTTSGINKSTSSSTTTTSTDLPTRSFRTQRRDSDDPSEDLGAPQPLMEQDMNTMMNQTFASMFGGVSGIPGTEGSPSFNPAALLGAMHADPSAGSSSAEQHEALLQNLLAGGSGGEEFNPASMFATMAGLNGTTEAETDKSTRYWNVLHLIMMCLLGIYSVYFEWTRAGSERFASLLYNGTTQYPSIHVPLFWYFITFELCMQSARMFYQQGTMPPTSTIAQLATQLPHPFGNIVTIFLRYRLIWTCLVQDICVLVFIIGLSQVIANVLL